MKWCTDSTQYSSAVRSRNRTQPPSSSIAELAANNENPKTVFDAAFEQHLNDLHIYPYSPWLDCTEGDRDINYVRQAIRAERLDVSMWHYDNHNSWENQANVQRCHVSAKIIHNFCGSTPKRSQLYSRFTVMEPMSKFHPDRRPMPTYFDGAPVQMLHDELKNDQKLRRLIVPSDDDEIPVAPNFFLEMAPDGYWDETVRRVAYFAAHGARAMHALQSYRDEDAQYDGMSYSAIYQADMQYLSLYIHYVTAPKTQDGRPTYHMHLIQEYLLREKDRFLEGVTALRNLGDLARRHRERFIEAANAKASTITHMIG